VRVLASVLLASLVLITSCGRSSSPQNSTPSLAGNWQIALTPNDQVTFQSRTLSGFAQQAGSNVNGSVSFLIPNVTNPSAPPCAGAAPLTGNFDGQSVNLSVNQNGQMLTLTGTSSSDLSSLSGTYTSPAGSCEPAENGLWTAILIKPIAGSFQGVLHSVSSNSYSLQDKDFQVTGTIIQGANTGATSATLTGTIAATNYQCFSTAALNGTVSGSRVRLSIIGTSGLQVGEMGAAVGSQTPGGATISPDALTLQGLNTLGTGYFMANTKACPFVNQSFDYGNFCLNFGSATSCVEPLSATPNNLTFPTLVVGDQTGPTQMITVTNQTSGPSALPINVTMTIAGLTSLDSPPDFSIVNQNCDPTQPTPPPQGPFQVVMASQATCTLGIKFVPSGSCPLDPTTAPPAKCPLPRTAQLLLADTLDPTTDPNNPHAVSLVGDGQSAIIPSVGELDFLPSQAGTLQTITFTNQTQAPAGEVVTILPTSINPSTGQPCTYSTSSGTPSGLQIVDFIFGACDGVAVGTVQQNFTIHPDNCSGKTLYPGDTCTLGITFTPQTTALIDVFLQINSSEPDTSRFLMELKGNVAALPTPPALRRRR
jgi:hypothetical protein